ncbi:MAG: ComF family protein [Patescibacteria group bacterium]|nr:ComF family protein [Patescibacteria group bacterium]
MEGKKLKKVKNFLLDLFFPKFCVGCGVEGEFICSDCSLFLSEASFICPSCEKSSYLGERHRDCRKRGFPEGLVSLWDYDGVARKGIHQAKYDYYIVETLNDLIDRFFIRLGDNKNRMSSFLNFLYQEDVVIAFVPAYKSRVSVKGFNQSELIAKDLGEKTGKGVVELLEKKKKNISQTNLNREERKKNVKGVFEMKKGVDVPSRVVLVDDVWTSGATMRECCKILKKNGVKKVWGFTLTKKA